MARTGATPTPPATSSKRLVAELAVVGDVEAAVRPLDEDAGARRQVAERLAVLADLAHGQPQEGSVGAAGHRVRVRAPPQVRRQEAPEQVLAAVHVQSRQVATGEVDADDARGLLDHAVDAHLVARRADHGDEHPAVDDEHGDAVRHRRPGEAQHGVADEGGAGGELVPPREEHGDVRREVQDPPRGVAHECGGPAGRRARRP